MINSPSVALSWNGNLKKVEAVLQAMSFWSNISHAVIPFLCMIEGALGILECSYRSLIAS